METLTIIGLIAVAIVAVLRLRRGKPAHSTYRLGRPPAGVRAVSPRLDSGASPIIFGPGAFPQLTGATSLGTLHTWSGTVGAWGGGTPIGSVDVGTLMFADGALLVVHICLLVLPDQLEVFEQETVPTGSSLAVLPYAD